MYRLALAGLLASLLAAPQEAQHDVEFPELGLSLLLPQMENFEKQLTPGGQTRGVWTGKLPSCHVRISLICLATEKWGFSEAGGVNDEFVSFYRRTRDFDVTSLKFFSGPYGIAPILAVSTGSAPPSDDGPVSEYIATGLTEEYGYGIHIECRPPPSTKDAPIFDEFFEDGIVFDSAMRNGPPTRSSRAGRRPLPTISTRTSRSTSPRRPGSRSPSSARRTTSS